MTSELRRIAAVQMSSEAAGHTLQPTALVNELCLRLMGRESVTWKNRAQFFGWAAQMMRRILIDHARIKKAKKRAGGTVAVPLEPGMAAEPAPGSRVDLLALDEALARLGRLDARQARVVELRFFGGLTIPEIAEVLETSPATVSRLWASAKAWLYGELAGSRGVKR